jgi:transposase
LHFGSLLAEFAPSALEPVDQLAAARAAARGEHGGRKVVEDGRPFPGEGNTTEPCDQWFPALSFDSGFEAPARFRYPGRRPVPDRDVLCGILYVLHTGVQWEYLPKELGFGSGMTCWRRLRDWNEAGVWQRLHEVLLAELNAASRLDWSRCVVDSSHVRALKGGSRRARRRSTEAGRARNTT